MSLLANIFGPAIGETVKGIGDGIGSLAKGIRTAITGIDPDKAAELEKIAAQAEVLASQAQSDINKIEAQSHSLFIAGWRPFIGWICGCALAFNYIINPLIEWIAKLEGKVITPPMLDMNQLYPLVLTLLGMGAYRTFEKAKGVSNKH